MALFLFFALVGLHEFYRMADIAVGYKARTFAGLLFGAVLFLIVALKPALNLHSAWLYIPVAAFVLLLSFELVKLEKGAIASVAITLLGWIYVVLPFALLTHLAYLHETFEYTLPLGFFAILWSNDTGAYAVGKLLGKKKLFPNVSPNKTIEGLLGGMCFSIAAALILSHFFLELSLSEWIGIALVVAIMANVGDLFESHIKRTCGLKDSGSLIPGHGGVLDRFDGLLFSLPFTLTFLNFYNLFV